MHGGDRVYSGVPGDRVYSRDRAAPGDRVHRVDATDAFMLCGAALAFVCGSMAWWLCSLCVALCERNLRNRRKQCLFELSDEDLFCTGHGPSSRGARDFSPRPVRRRWQDGGRDTDTSDDEDTEYYEYAEY
jgi:hypothetical protein